MTRSYGEVAAGKRIDENAEIVMAVLDGNLEALRALLDLTAQAGYVAGFGTAASLAGVTL